PPLATNQKPTSNQPIDPIAERAFFPSFRWSGWSVPFRNGLRQKDRESNVQANVNGVVLSSSSSSSILQSIGQHVRD
uniref:Uncharacterized protein n=1 Tax=Anopheles albimanus TaxID=7167 RepID=A0A182FY98_ANOAL